MYREENVINKENHAIVKRYLEAALGPEYVSDDPAILECHAKDSSPSGILLGKRPEFVVLPGNAEDVAAVVKICNRFKKPFITGALMYQSTCTPLRPGYVLIDMKRMNRIIEINEKDMYAVVEPLVTFAELNAEAQKRGLFVQTPPAGMSSVVANHLFAGFTQLSWRFGISTRNILAFEWVLPTGEIVKTGSLNNGSWIWGEGPGPDLRGLIKGLFGVGSGLGIVTKMAVKLHRWPGPRDFTKCVKSSSPYVDNAWKGGWRMEFNLPQDKIRNHIIAYPSIEKLCEAIKKLGEAEICASVAHLPAWFMCCESAQSQQEFWDLWNSNYYQTLGDILGPGIPAYALFVTIAGFTSPKQLDYEEKVLTKIIEETGGKFVPKDSRIYYEMITCYFAGEIWRPAGAKNMRPRGSFVPTRFIFESVENAAEIYQYLYKWTVEAASAHNLLYPSKGGLDDFGHFGLIASYDFGHMIHVAGFNMYYDQSDLEQVENVRKVMKKGLEDDIEKGIGTSYAPRIPEVHAIVGPMLYNYHVLLLKIKKTLDPNNVANPPFPIEISETQV